MSVCPRSRRGDCTAATRKEEADIDPSFHYFIGSGSRGLITILSPVVAGSASQGVLSLASQTELEPTVFHAAWRHRLLVATSAILGLVLGIGVTVLFPSTLGFVATASLILQEPDSESFSSSPRFLANQVEVMTSILVSEEAARLLSEENPDLGIRAVDILESTEVSGGSSSDLVLIVHESETAEGAVATVNALIQAYENVSRIGSTSTAEAALERIDVQLQSLESRLATVLLEIESINAQDTLKSTLASQAEEALAQIANLQARSQVAGEDELEQIQSELNDLKGQLDLYRLITSINQTSPELATAEAEESQLINRRADLLSRRDEIAFELQLAPSPILLAVPAAEAVLIPPPGVARFAAGGLILGLLAGAGIAYWLLVRRRTFTSKLEPETTLGAPLIAEVSDFASEAIRGPLPVRDDPRTVVAEDYRFAATSLELKASSASVRSIMVVSASIGNGKTTTVANAALAMAREGHRVLAIDADLGNQELARLLGGEDAVIHPGLSEVIDADMPIDLAVQELSLGDESHLFLIGRGQRPVTAPDLLRQPSAQRFFQDVREQFDLVLVDAPPLLQVAYASTLLRNIDAGLVIVGHESPVGELEEVANRMAFFGVPAIGYIYNKAPMRRDLPRSGGSLMDVLGAKGNAPRDLRG